MLKPTGGEAFPVAVFVVPSTLFVSPWQPSPQPQPASSHLCAAAPPETTRPQPTYRAMYLLYDCWPWPWSWTTTSFPHRRLQRAPPCRVSWAYPGNPGLGGLASLSGCLAGDPFLNSCPPAQPTSPAAHGTVSVPTAQGIPGTSVPIFTPPSHHTHLPSRLL